MSPLAGHEQPAQGARVGQAGRGGGIVTRGAGSSAVRRGIAPGEVTFVQGSFLELSAADLGGVFDLVNSVGVVHHLASPAAGLRALRALLRPEGAMFLMVYGALGRTGVYDIQDMWRLAGMPRRHFLAGPLQVPHMAAAPPPSRA